MAKTDIKKQRLKKVSELPTTAKTPSPRVRQDHSSEYEDYKIAEDVPNAYSKVSGAHYLQSDAVLAYKKKRKRNRVAKIVGVVLLVLVLVGGVGAFAFVNVLNSNLSKGLDPELNSVLAPIDTPTDPFYVLLLGTDGSQYRDQLEEFQGDEYRTDSMMLARIDPKGKKATIISIPRDTKVDMGPEFGDQKINNAHVLGGPKLAITEVSKLAGVPIAHYAEINLDGFSQIVDALGGVEVNVPIEINDIEAGGHLDAGLQTLDGGQALILCRSRHAYDDYGPGDLYRAANQRMVLSAVAHKLLQSDALTIANTVQSLAGCVTTDMSAEEIIGIANSMRGMDSAKDMYTCVMPTHSELIDEIWYEILDKEEWTEMMARVEEGLPPVEENVIDDETGTILATGGKGATVNGRTYMVDRTDSIRIRNGNGTDGVCADAQDILTEMGYSKFDVGNADDFDYETTMVIYKNPADKQYADQMVEAFGLGESVPDDETFLFDSDFLVVIGRDWKLDKVE